MVPKVSPPPSLPEKAQSGPARVSPPSAATVAAVGTSLEYHNLEKPRSYDPPSRTSSDPGYAGFWTLDEDVGVGQTSVLDVEFVSLDS